jgi:hypothetical protein
MCVYIYIYDISNLRVKDTVFCEVGKNYLGIIGADIDLIIVDHI